MDGRRAVKAGLTFRPLADTARDIITEYKARPAAPANRRVRFGLAPEREKELLAAWHQQAGR